MSKSKIQQKFDAGESINWFELVEWEKEVLEEQRVAREKGQKSDQTESSDESVNLEPSQLELEAADAKRTENGSVPGSLESIPLKSLLEIGQFKLESAPEKLPEAQAETAGSGNEPRASLSGLLDSQVCPSKIS
jgi:hypothetical protein